MAIETGHSLSHYTDWTIGHVHLGALGWVAMISVGRLSTSFPLFGKTEMYSMRLVTLHFLDIGVVLYIAAMWIAGVMQGLMWRCREPGRHADLLLCGERESHLAALRHRCQQSSSSPECW